MCNDNHIENAIEWSSKGWYQQASLNQLFQLVRSSRHRDTFALRSCLDTYRLAVMLTHTDGRRWLLAVNENHTEGPCYLSLFEYKSKSGSWGQATDAQSVAFDKMVFKALGISAP